MKFYFGAFSSKKCDCIYIQGEITATTDSAEQLVLLVSKFVFNETHTCKKFYYHALLYIYLVIHFLGLQSVVSSNTPALVDGSHGSRILQGRSNHPRTLAQARWRPKELEAAMVCADEQANRLL
jgi:hypothetical protein